MRIFILFQLFSVVASAQLPRTQHYYSVNGFCSSTILLDSIGNFYREDGCEGRSRISLGTYTLKGNIVKFTFGRFADSPPIFDIVTETNPSSQAFITVTFLTRQGNKLASNAFSVDAIDTSGRFFQTLSLNGAGQIAVDTQKHKELRLDYLEKLYGKEVRIQLSNKSITVILNQPQIFFNYLRPIPEKGIDFSMRVEKDGLYSGIQKAFSSEE